MRRYSGKKLDSRLANQEDKLRVVAMFSEYFSTVSVTTGELEPPEWAIQPEELSNALNEHGDLGVEKWVNADEETLRKVLGFQDGRPIGFAKYRCRDSMVNSWPDPRGEEKPEYAKDAARFTDENAENDDEMALLQSLWHQMVGNAAMCDLIFSEEKTYKPGFILADGTGLGKSCEILSTIAILIQVHESEKRGTGRPPILGEWHI